MWKNIYLCDDDPEDCEIFHQALMEISGDFTLTSCNDGDDLILQIYDKNSRRPDVIFLDINMPRKDGIETLQEIKSHTHLFDIPVIIYTTSSYSLHKQAAYALGAARYLIKQSDQTLLKKHLSYLLRESFDTTVSMDNFVLQ